MNGARAHAVALIGDGNRATHAICARCAIKCHAMPCACGSGVDIRAQIANDQTHIAPIAWQFVIEINPRPHAERRATGTSQGGIATAGRAGAVNGGGDGCRGSEIRPSHLQIVRASVDSHLGIGVDFASASEESHAKSQSLQCRDVGKARIDIVGAGDDVRQIDISGVSVEGDASLNEGHPAGAIAKRDSRGQMHHDGCATAVRSIHGDSGRASEGQTRVAEIVVEIKVQGAQSTQMEVLQPRDGAADRSRRSHRERSRAAHRHGVRATAESHIAAATEGV